MTIHTETIEYMDGEVKCIGTATWDTAIDRPKPCVLISHDWSGRNEFSQARAEEMAELGYVGFALDNYGDNKRGTNTDENQALMMPFIEDRAKLLSRLKAGFEAAKALDQVASDKISIIGFCFGGLCALDLARSGEELCTAISFHGLFMPNGLEPKKIKAKVLALHGYLDPLAPPEAMTALAEELTEAGCDWQILAFGGTLHAFTNPKAADPENGFQFNPTSKRRAWAAAKQLLVESFAAA